MFFYSSLLALALVVSAPWWLWRMATSGRYRAGLAGRLGLLPRQLDGVIAARGAAGGLIWLHAVSVGEVLAAQRLVSELRTALPASQVVVSTTTAAGYKVASEKLGIPVFYFPLDFAFAVRRYLHALRPSLFVTTESEFWPRMLVECERAGIPVAVVNARVSDRSFPRYMRLRRLWRPLLAKVKIFLAQGEETAERLRQIGVSPNRIQVTGNLKYDAPGGGDNAMVQRVASLLPHSRILVAGSTAEGEEEILLEVWPTVLQQIPDAAFLIAPRHPQRFDTVLALIQKGGYGVIRCSELASTTESITSAKILLLDTVGDLAAMYSIASAAFVGGSLVPKGGQNPNEPARFGVPVVMGSSYENFREMVNAMLQSGAIRVVNRETLAQALVEAMRAKTTGQRHLSGQTGATQRTVDALLELVR
jgi:3-deoxy-D-manno-octulosonic-acid transferase